MESKRQQRIQKLLQKDLGIIFQQDFSMIIKNAMITVTKVNITPDLGLAKVYLSIFATTGKEEVLKVIRKHTSEIRGKLGNRIRHQLRQVPELHFYEDDSLDYIERIDDLLNEEPSI